MQDLALAVFVHCLLPALLIVAVFLLTCFVFGNSQDQPDAERPETDHRAYARWPVSDTPLPSVEAAQTMAYIAKALLDRVSYPRHNIAAAASDAASAGTGGDPATGIAAGTSSESEDCAICLSTFDEGDWCSIMPVCRHEFHRACIRDWLMTYNNSCPLCRAQLRWSVVVEDMV